MLKPELLRVLALTGALVTIIEVPGVISLRAFARKVGSMDMRVARSLRFGTRLPTLAMDSQSRRPLASTVANAEKAYEPRIPRRATTSGIRRFRNGVRIGRSTVSTGAQGHRAWAPLGGPW